MKKFICCLGLLFSASAVFSQKVYFVYLQTDTEPFFVKMNEQVYTSGTSGYIILSKLRDSSYAFSVAFPQNKWPEQQFKVDIKGKDHGYLVKDFGEKGWGLYDLQTSSVLMAAPQPAKATSRETMEVSAFTDILAKAANDPSLRERPVAVKQPETQVQPIAAVNKEEKETVPIQAIAKTEKKEEPAVAVVEKKPTVTVDPPKQTLPFPAEEKTAAVNKEKEKEKQNEKEKTTDTVVKTNPPVTKEETPVLSKTEKLQQPVVQSAPRTDPPVTKDEPVVAKIETPPVIKEEVKEKKEEAKPVVTEAADVYKPSVVRRRSESSTTEGFGLMFTDEYPDGKKDTIRIIIPPVRYMNVAGKEPAKPTEKKFLDISTDPKETVKPAAAKNCLSVAEESDFLKLRKRMAASNKEDGMVSEAARHFKSKCFTVAQLKNLSGLFLNDAGKYKFFDAAYTHVSDAENFSSLQAELKDEYYVNRFKAMLR